MHTESSRIVVHSRFASLRAFIGDLPARFDSEGSVVYAKRNVVKRFIAPDGLPLIVKQYKRPNFIQQLGYSTFRPSKARRAYEFALRFLALGIATPTPVAYIEARRNGWFATCWFIALETDLPSCKILFRPDFTDAPLLSHSLMQFIADMHARGILHGDTNLSNFLYQPPTDPGLPYRLSVIDINRTRFRRHPSRRDCLDNLMRLTHEVPLLSSLVTIYARLRGWDAATSVDYVVRRLHAFERRKRLTKRLKSFLPALRSGISSNGGV